MGETHTYTLKGNAMFTNNLFQMLNKVNILMLLFCVDGLCPGHQFFNHVRDVSLVETVRSIG